ncbi:MAG: protein kinase [Acidobacteriota bacterium]
MMATIFHRLGPFEILREIGRGGMAVVFLASDTRSGRRVALKLVPEGTDREAHDVLAAEQWGAELQQQFCLVSPHVPAVYEHGIESGYFFVAMEYLDGENLSDVITRGPLEIGRAVATAIELCRFLEDAHRFEAVIGDRNLRSLLHGDLKPRNIRITASHDVKVLDFGIAKALSLSRKVTRNDFGSVAYLSPERLESGDVDGYADYWAIGVLLYEMVSGTAPFQASDTRRLERQILSRLPPSSLAGRCPIGVQAVVAKLLGPRPIDRYETAAAIRQDLEQITAGNRTRAEQEGWPARAADEQATRRTRSGGDSRDDVTRRTTTPADIPPPATPADRQVPSEGAGDFISPAAAAGPPAPLDAPLVLQPASDDSRAGVLIASEPSAPPAAAPSPLPLPRLRRATRVVSSRRFLRLALVLFVVGIVGNELWVAKAAGRVAGLVPTRELGQLAEVWSQYDALSNRSYLRIGTRSLRRSLTQQTADLAERVIADYRTPLPTVREAQWSMARDALARAMAVTPGSRQLRAALRYCDGHLHRINGDARKNRKQGAAAQREFTAAVTAFREAAELRPDWPDPFLGLARTFIYGLEDVDRGGDALNQAQHYGYTPGNRETAQLGDGYRARADTLARRARQLANMPEERDSLVRAAEAYRQALSFYTRAADFAGVPANIRLAERGLGLVERRLAELSQPPAENPTPPGAASAGAPRRRSWWG